MRWAYVSFFVFLAASFSTAAIGDDQVACTQQILTDLGYNPGPVDGALGKRTISMASAAAEATGITLPTLSKDNAEEWCTQLTAYTASPAAKLLSGKSRLVIPADVLAKLSMVDAETAGRLCRVAARNDFALRLEPVAKIEGFNSRMDNLEGVPFARRMEAFAGEFGKRSIGALVTNDTASKTELVQLLAKWARAGALLETRSCVKGGILNTSGKCSEWTQDDGQDLSGMKDATFVTFLGAGIIRAYYAGLADHDREVLAPEHEAIDGWIAKFSQRLKRPGEVYFGLNMGWYWPSVLSDLAAGKTGDAASKLKKIEQGLVRLINDDGSITDRTTRGNRALWYHFTSTGEIVMSMELMRSAGIAPSSSLETKLHKAVRLFLDALTDPKILDKWAIRANNSVFDGTQDWDLSWQDGDFAGSWLHIYPYRYPDRPEGQELRKLVPISATSATTDIDYGLGVGCVYNAAAAAR